MINLYNASFIQERIHDGFVYSTSPSSRPLQADLARSQLTSRAATPDASCWKQTLESDDCPPLPKNHNHNHIDGCDDGQVDTRFLAFFDRTLLDLGFDLSCLRDLDEQLLAYPIESFEDLCWSQAVEADDVDTFEPAQSPTSISLSHFFGSEPEYDYDDQDDDNDNETLESSLIATICIQEGVIALSSPARYLKSEEEWSQNPLQVDHYNPPHLRSTSGISHHKSHPRSLIYTEPHFPMRDPNHSVHFFPVPSQKPPKPSPSGVKRLANACAGYLGMSRTTVQ